MQSQPQIMSMQTAVKFLHERPFLLDEYLHLLSEQGDLTYDPDSSYVPDTSVVAECHDPLSTAEAVVSGLATKPNQAIRNSSSSEPADDSLLSQCTYLEDVPLSQLLFDAGELPYENAEEVSSFAPATAMGLHQNADDGRMPDMLPGEAAAIHAQIVSEITADDVIDLEREQPMVINDAFPPSASNPYSEQMQWDGSGPDQQVPSSSDDEEALDERRRILQSCTRDAVVPVCHLVEE